MKRRTHQTVEVPALPNQEVFQTLINLPIEERSGGYQVGNHFFHFFFEDCVKLFSIIRNLIGKKRSASLARFYFR